MRIPDSWQFRSITYRLIAACVVAACLIYGVSFTLMRHIVDSNLVEELAERAQAQVGAVSSQAGQVFAAVEQEAGFVLAVQEQTAAAGAVAVSPLLRTALLARLEGVSAIAYAAPGYSAPAAEGYRLNDGGDAVLLDPQALAGLLSACAGVTGEPRPQGRQVWRHAAGAGQPSLVYCVSPPLQRAGRPRLLAIQVKTDWLPALVGSGLRVNDQLSHLPLGSPFVLDTQTGQWLLAPTDSAATTPARVAQGLWSERTASRQADAHGILAEAGLAPGFLRIGITIPKGALGPIEWQYLLLAIASMGKDMLLIIIAIALVSRQTTRGLRTLTAMTEDIARGRLDAPLPVIAQRDEVGRLSRAFRHMRDALNRHIHDLQLATAQRQKLESELAIASQIQRSMVPVIDVTGGAGRRYEVSAVLQPARVVGGDFYDYFPIGADRLCIAIGDVADKGIPAALLMARTIALLRALGPQLETPARILAAVNRELCENNDECMFVTLFCSVLDLPSGVLSHASAGHDPPLLLRAGSARFLPQETGAAVGVEPDVVYPEQQIVLQGDDLLVLYTDGITEALNPQGELFSGLYLQEAVAAHPHPNPARAIRTIQHVLRRFVAGAPQADDITMLALCYQPSSPYIREISIVDWTITINNELARLDEVKQRIGSLMRSRHIPVDRIEDTQLIVEEVLVNIVEHNQSGARHDISLRLVFDGDELVLSVEDSGKPFNPLLEIEQPDLSQGDEERAEGGFGFHLVRELSVGIDYAWRDGKNLLTVRQRLRT